MTSEPACLPNKNNKLGKPADTATMLDVYDW